MSKNRWVWTRKTRQLESLLTTEQKKILVLEAHVNRCKDDQFAKDLLRQWKVKGFLTSKQWFYVSERIKRA